MLIVGDSLLTNQIFWATIFWFISSQSLLCYGVYLLNLKGAIEAKVLHFILER